MQNFDRMNHAIKKTTRIVSCQNYDAAIFDMDGVITQTANVHAFAWKSTFDQLLHQRKGDSFRPFDIDSDYRLYVDGKLRQDGVRDFLASRNIRLPLGKSRDKSGFETCWAVGNLKDKLFRKYIAEHGVQTFSTTVKFINELRELGLKIGIITASRNGRMMLNLAGLDKIYDVLIDGIGTARLHLQGKPAPDVFLKAAEFLETPPARAIVTEDAIAGIEAAKEGGFGMIIGIDRKADGKLLQSGADMVVGDLSEVKISGRKV